MKRLTATICLLAGALLFLPATAFAAGNGEIESFTGETITTLIGVASLVAVFFLIRGGYIYITSTGKPEALSEAKRTIRNALIGLAIVIGAGVIYSLFNTAFTQPATSGGGQVLNLNPIQPTEQDSSLAKILMDAIAGFLQNIVQSAAKPILDAITGFLTNTPSLANNSVVFNFWLIMIGITDSLFALVIALLGFQVMGAATFGFEELSLKELLPRIGLAFLVANTSIFLIDWLILLCQTLVNAVLHATGGIGSAWILNAFDPAALVSGSTLLITLIFMIVFMLLSAVLLLFYISRLMLLAFGAVVSPLICLLWLIPKTADFAESTVKAYLVTIFSIFTHVIIIQLASAFLTVPGQVGTNPLISVLIGIAMFSILLKSTAVTVQLALTSQTTGVLKKFGGQLFNVLSPATAKATHASVASTARKAREVVR
ncbi:hypothetical protein KGQ71_02110 [Patescibacteria group bacterium]|nr:hypothetical protein [Patescibacteria group bacterium]